MAVGHHPGYAGLSTKLLVAALRATRFTDEVRAAFAAVELGELSPAHVQAAMRSLKDAGASKDARQAVWVALVDYLACWNSRSPKEKAVVRKHRLGLVRIERAADGRPQLKLIRHPRRFALGSPRPQRRGHTRRLRSRRAGSRSRSRAGPDDSDEPFPSRLAEPGAEPGRRGVVGRRA